MAAPIIEFAALDGSGNIVGWLPDHNGFELSPVFCDVGAFTFSYPKNGINANLVAAERELAVYRDGAEVTKWRCVIEGLADDDAPATEDAEVVKWQGRFYIRTMEHAVVHPINWPSTTPPDHTFTAATPGTIISTLLTKAQARGTITQITLGGSVSGTVDSNGVAWPTSISLTYDPGVNYMQVLLDLFDKQLLEFEMRGHVLWLFKFGTMGTDRTTGGSPVVLFAGRDIREAPKSGTSKDLATVVLGIGDIQADGSPNLAESTDPTAIATYGRREMPLQLSGIQDNGTVQWASTQALSLWNFIKVERTVGLAFDDALSPVPDRDFSVGDWVLVDTNNLASGPDRRRVLQYVLSSSSSDDDVVGSVSLDSLLEDNATVVQRLLDRLQTGTAVSTQTYVDYGVPAAPAAVSFTSAAYVDSAGIQRAQITVTWSQVTQNVDGSAANDIAGYIVTAVATAGSRAMYTVRRDASQLSATFSPFLLGESVTVTVVCFDSNNNTGGGTSYTANTAVDTTPPPVPTTPTVDTTTFGGVIRVLWDGLGVGGVSMPNDFKMVEVHASTVNNFTPSAATLVDTLPAQGVAPVTGIPSTPMYFKLISVDTSNNKSNPSAQASGTVRQLVDTDIINGAITEAKVATAAISVDKIAAAAVTGVKIATDAIDASKIQASAVTGVKIATDAIDSTKIAAGAVTASELGADAVTSAALAADAVDAAAIQNGAVGTLKLADLAVVQAKIADLAVGTAQIAAAAVTNAKIGTAAVGTANIANAAITNALIGNLAVSTAQIQDAAIVEAKINNLAVTTAKINDLAVNEGKIASAAISTAKIQTAAITTALIGDLQVVEAKIGSLAVSSGKIQDAAIVTAKIGDLQVLNAKIGALAVNDAKIANVAIGKLTAGSLSADMTVSARIKTADTGARVELNSTGIHAYNSGGTETVRISSDGSAWFLGSIQSGSSITGTTITGSSFTTTGAGYPSIQVYIASGTAPIQLLANGYGYGGISCDQSQYENIRMSSVNTGFVAYGGGGVTATVYASSASITVQVNRIDYVATSGGQHYFDAGLTSQGNNAGFTFAGRNGSSSWEWYSPSGGTAVLWKDGSGDVLVVDTSNVYPSTDYGLNIGASTRRFQYLHSNSAYMYGMGTNSGLNVVWMAGGGLAHVSSSRDYKTGIEAALPVMDILDILQPVTYHVIGDIEAGYDDDFMREIGLIAEDIHAAGLKDIVQYTIPQRLVGEAEDGKPIWERTGEPEVPAAVKYDRIPLLLLPVLRDMRDRLAAVEAKLGSL